MKREKLLRLSIVAVYLLAGIGYLLTAPTTTGDAGRTRAAAGEPPQGGAATEACRFPLPLPSAVGDKDFETQIIPFLQQRCYRTLKWMADREIRNTGPFISGTAFGTHPAVRIYYSPEMWRWMKEQQRKGEIPDGAMIVKEQYSTPASESSTLSGWTVMVRDKNGSWDGWYWDGHGLSDTPDTPPFDFKGQGFGTYCIRCHASALAGTGTFSAPRNVEEDPISYLTQLPTLPTPPTPATIPSLHEKARAAHLANVSDLAAPVPPNVRSFPNEGFDHVVSAAKGPGQFLTSDQCIGCHSASDTNMAYLFGPRPINLSPYTEWRASMMGLAGRDPVFHSQLESERAQFPDKSAFLDNKCFQCHGVMGQRQLHLDKKQNFTHDMIYALADQPPPQNQYAKYGALARDGVSCMVCHQIAARGIGPDGKPVVTGEPSSYTGNFPVDAPGTINGPFADVQELPMKNGLGITPRFADQIKRSTICGTCHTVVLPVFDRNGKEIIVNGKPKEFHEQTTYLEWQNSDYQDERPPVDTATARTCQACHMPAMYKQTPLTFRIANIEDVTYPYVDNRLPDADITLKTRDYSRHTLVALNVFVNQMFQQFNEILGVAPNDYMYPVAGNGAKPVEGLVTTEQSMLEMACNETADVEVVSAQKTGDQIAVAVKVTNLAGHSFPSGVEFRRAFVNLRLLDAGGQALWASGETNRKGEILDGLSDKILPTEHFDLICPGVSNPEKCRAVCRDKIIPGICREQIQPHYFSGNPITRGDQVQIYEELVVDSDGFLTNSFVRLDEHVKDNRLLPKGWRPDGPSAEFTRPFADAARDPGYINPVKGQGSEGSNTVVYRIPLKDIKGDVASVTAALFYQSIPPYYLRDRFSVLERNLPPPMTRETVRLKYLADNLKVENTSIKDWKLLINCRTRRLSDGGQSSCAPCQERRGLLTTTKN